VKRSVRRNEQVLVVDVGGTHVKLLASGHTRPRKFASGKSLTAAAMVARVKRCARGWTYGAVVIGYPGVVLRGRPVVEPHNLASGWVGFDFAKAFEQKVLVVNDAALQALGSYQGRKLLFLGLGTGLGSALVVDGVVEPLELGHLPYKKGTYEDYVGKRGLKRLGKKKWRHRVIDVIGRLAAALEPEEIVIGGGNAKHLKELPEKCRRVDNSMAFAGGFKAWQAAAGSSKS